MRTRRLILATIALTMVALLSSVGAVAAAPGGFTTFAVQLEPQAPNEDGSGVAVVRVNPTTGEVCHVITVSGIGEPTEPAGGLGAAHIHDFATGGIFVDLDTEWRAAGLDRYLSIECTTATSASLMALLANPDAYYVNVHTVAFPGGALSGPLG
jgi:hypothetical protein